MQPYQNSNIIPHKTCVCTHTYVHMRVCTGTRGIFIIPSYSKLYYRAIVIKIPLNRHKRSHLNQCNREDPDINTHSNNYLTFDKDGKNIHWRKDSLFSKWYWKNWTSSSRMETRSLFLILKKREGGKKEREKKKKSTPQAGEVA